MPLVWVSKTQTEQEAQKMEKTQVENSENKILNFKNDKKVNKPMDTLVDEPIAASIFKKESLGIWMVRMESDE